MGTPDGPAHGLGPGRDADILRERDRIAAELQHEVIQRVFSIGLDLQSTAAITIDPLVRRRVEQAINDLDQLAHIIRDTVFGLEHHLKTRGFRAGIVHLCEHLSPVPAITFRGPVDGALPPTATAELLDIVADALALIGTRWLPVAIGVTAAGGAHVTTLQAVPRSQATADDSDDQFPSLHARAAQAGIRIEIQPGPGLVQICWHAA